MGVAVVLCWLLLGLVLVLYGRLYGSRLMLGAGAAMLALVAGVADVSW